LNKIITEANLSHQWINNKSVFYPDDS